jgi:SAM-dependent methyltransferase
MCPCPPRRRATRGLGWLVSTTSSSRSSAPPQSATGVDRAPAMLAQAPELPAGWRLLEADARALPFANESFDVVTASYLLHLLDRDDRARVIAEARRVLRPGGRLGVVTVAPPAGRLSSLASRPIRALAARSSGALAGLRPLDPREELKAAGLRPLRGRRARAVPPSLCVVAERVHRSAFRGDMSTEAAQ